MRTTSHAHYGFKLCLFLAKRACSMIWYCCKPRQACTDIHSTFVRGRFVDLLVSNVCCNGCFCFGNSCNGCTQTRQKIQPSSVPYTMFILLGGIILRTQNMFVLERAIVQQYSSINIRT